MLNFVLWALIVAWKSSERMNYGHIIFSLHWKIWKRNYRLIRLITFFLHIFCFVVWVYYWFLIQSGLYFLTLEFFNMIYWLSLENQISLTKLALFENILNLALLAISKTWTRTLNPDPRPRIRTLDLEPEKPWPWRTWTLKNMGNNWIWKND